jgi:hypothetical protein
MWSNFGFTYQRNLYKKTNFKKGSEKDHNQFMLGLETVILVKSPGRTSWKEKLKKIWIIYDIKSNLKLNSNG